MKKKGQKRAFFRKKKKFLGKIFFIKIGFKKFSRCGGTLKHLKTPRRFFLFQKKIPFSQKILDLKKFFFFFWKKRPKKGLFWAKKNVKIFKNFFFWMVFKIVLGYFFQGNDTLGDPWGPRNHYMSSFGIASILEKKWFFFFLKKK